jgi:hypothetical protein
MEGDRIKCEIPAGGPKLVDNGGEESQSLGQWEVGWWRAEVEDKVEESGWTDEVQREMAGQDSLPDGSLLGAEVHKVGQVFVTVTVDTVGILRV